MSAIDTVSFEYGDVIYDAEVTAILDDGATVELDITDPAWTGTRAGWFLDTIELRPRCECGNPFKLCHPDA